MKRIPRPPRPDWRDPNMPVLLTVQHEDGGPWVLEPFPPDRVRQSYVNRMNVLLYSYDPRIQERAPHWSKDPTYNLRRK